MQAHNDLFIGRIGMALGLGLGLWILARASVRVSVM